jgi:hypothetical protein
MTTMRALVRDTIQDFCCEFTQNPYLCYTEHGQHALFFSRLLAAMPDAARYAMWRGQRVCTIQKEYPTAASLGKSKRQHWDISLLEHPLVSKPGSQSPYDFLRLSAVVEFGMNEASAHLTDDIARIRHPDSQVAYGFVVHLVRLSDGKDHFSMRDQSPASKRIADLAAIVDALQEAYDTATAATPVEVWYAVADLTASREVGVWRVHMTDASGQAATDTDTNHPSPRHQVSVSRIICPSTGSHPPSPG